MSTAGTTSTTDSSLDPLPARVFTAAMQSTKIFYPVTETLFAGSGLVKVRLGQAVITFPDGPEGGYRRRQTRDARTEHTIS